MEHGTSLDFPGMHVELYLSADTVPSDAIVIPKLPHEATITDIRTGTEDLSNCDALTTEDRSKTLGIKTADCAPVCMSDETRIGIAHIGWRGLCLGLVEKMRDRFSQDSLQVYVAPFLNSFEIKKDFCYEQIVEKCGTTFLDESGGRIIFDFKAAIAVLLPRETVFDLRTTENLSFPSYRRDKTTERYITTVRFPSV
ncbi:hypothetical protein COU19_00615 [Candidatus Kaiserbacteria bacterium CG10_big_fil_rev_8_21_14_0_10_56_12]|uniref:Laccase domain-containing protein n=1 Tax=Candidatus Kaiserbacteria bacterium CG10_big_fil_rev_8_21_14_0_10_56_12 TaxID=1974611 RepID=A0A2H0UAS8_9BACT|nr:MAG: hypothetical protein COU19_00615 [Candidatus Kaiserbacteria bacterium CG10_big_fil_rev_8_21_14_0_10_56_12]